MSKSFDDFVLVHNLLQYVVQKFSLSGNKGFRRAGIEWLASPLLFSNNLQMDSNAFSQVLEPVLSVLEIQLRQIRNASHSAQDRVISNEG